MNEGPPHQQSYNQKTGEDAPKWWIDAHIMALKYGTGVILYHLDKEPECLPPEKYLEFAEALKWAHAEITGLHNTQP